MTQINWITNVSFVGIYSYIYKNSETIFRHRNASQPQNIGGQKGETRHITSNLRLRNPIWITINKLMYKNNLFITESVTHCAPRRRALNLNEIYKKRSFSTVHYGQNVILCLTYHHYRVRITMLLWVFESLNLTNLLTRKNGRHRMRFSCWNN